jgi:hypothetical protein
MRVETNKTMFGKRNPEFPYKAIIDDQYGNPETIALGETVGKARENAENKLLDSYRAAQAPMVVRIASDGTTYVARWTSSAEIEYWIYRNGERGGGCMGLCKQSLQSYMDEVVRQYNECIAA